MSDRSDYVVIGAGPAGTRAAETMRRRDPSARIVVVSDDVHPFYNRILLSKQFLENDGIAPQSMILKSTEEYVAQGIELRSETRVLRLDPSGRALELSRGEKLSRLTYEKCLIASGARPLRLPIPGGDHPGLRYLRTLEDARALRAAARGAGRAIVVGGGLIGVEVAAALAGRGIPCTLLAREEWLFGHMAPEMVGRALERVFRSNGVELGLSTTVTAIEPVTGSGGKEGLAVHAGGRRLEADLVAVGVGVAPVVGFLRGTGLAAPDGVPVDDRQRTAAPGVFAAGDVARFADPVLGVRHRVEHWLHAQHHGRRAAENMTGADAPYARVTSYDTILFGLPVAAYGAPILATEWVQPDSLREGVGVAYGLREGRALAAFRIGDAEETSEILRRIESAADRRELEHARR